MMSRQAPSTSEPNKSESQNPAGLVLNKSAMSRYESQNLAGLVARMYESMSLVQVC